MPPPRVAIELEASLFLIRSGQLGIAWKTSAPHCSRTINFYARPWGGGLSPARCPIAQRPRGGGQLKPAGRARGWRGRGSRSAAQRLLTLHVFRHLPLFPMRSSQSQGFGLHFGQHDRAAADGDRGSVSVWKPSTWTRAAQIQLRRQKGRGDWGASHPRARRSAPPPPPPGAAGKDP